MSTVKSKKLQVGTDATSSNNFTIYQPATPDGTLRIGVGNADSPTEVGRFDSNGYVATNAPAFSARQSSAQTVATGTDTTLICDLEDFDTNSCYNNTGSTVGGIPAYSFKPTVAGYYQVNSAFRINMVASTILTISLFKNGASFNRILSYSPVSTFVGLGISSLVYLNGTTDYISTYVAQYTGSNQSTVSASSQNFFQAAMVRGA